MYKKLKFLGVITARGGSKNIPGKNIKLLLGKPLIAYTIEAAQQSGVFDRLILSTDDPKIAEVAKQCGCEVPFMRPVELAQDDTLHLPVMQHAVQWLKNNEDYWPDYVMILQPPSPLRQPFHIQEAAELLLKNKADSVLAVAELPESFSPARAMLIKDSFLELYNGRPVRQRIARRQDLPRTYWNTCSIYLFKTDLLFDPIEPNFFGKKIVPYLIEKKYAIDVNNFEDWHKAEEALRNLEKN